MENLRVNIGIRRDRPVNSIFRPPQPLLSPLSDVLWHRRGRVQKFVFFFYYFTGKHNVRTS